MKKQTQKQKEALRKRVYDIYLGASGEEYQEDMVFYDLEDGERILIALGEAFRAKPDENDNDFLFRSNNLSNYSTPDKATEFLFDHGVRA